MVTKVKSGVIGDNSVGITQLNVSDGSNGQALVTNGSGTLSFASVGVSGISSSADATAITIDSSENVGIGTGSPNTKLHVEGGFVVRSSSSSVFNDSNNAENVRMLDAGIIFNADAIDKDFTIKSDNNAAMFHVDAGNDKVGIGTTSPATILHAKASGDCELRLEAGTNSDARVRFGDATDNDLGYIGFNRNSGYMNFSINNTSGEHMRINSNGSLMVGTTSNPSYPHKIYAVGSAIPDGIVHFRDTDTTVALSNAIMSLQFSGDNDATNGYFIYMTDGNGAIGAIQAASGTSVSYGTSSDERLKKNIVDASSQLDMLKSVKVREFDWKRNDHHELGLIAQEIKDIIPNVVQQGGDDVTKNPWSVDYGKLTPYLLKALQEQQTIIEDLKSRIETLEG